jgi:hypothetical protein
MLLKKYGLSNNVSTSLARKIYKKIGEEGMSTLQKYIKTGKDAYKFRAQQVADEIANAVKSLPAPSGNPLTKMDSQVAAEANMPLKAFRI